jgi:trehalose 6-phosphate synthase/phosphatase
MDSFSEPYTCVEDDISLDEVRAQVRALEDDHRANGIQLSGRVLHVCHYLPVTCTLASRAGVLSPPATPPVEVSANPICAEAIGIAANVIEHQPTWRLAPRYGHSAMISGIRSLSATHEQLIIGWTGDIGTDTPGERVPTSSIPQKDKDSLEDALATYTPREADPDDDKKTHYVPVWQDDKVAHGHYDGYCKTSEFIFEALCLALGNLLDYGVEPDVILV